MVRDSCSVRSMGGAATGPGDTRRGRRLRQPLILREPSQQSERTALMIAGQGRSRGPAARGFGEAEFGTGRSVDSQFDWQRIRSGRLVELTQDGRSTGDRIPTGLGANAPDGHRSADNRQRAPSTRVIAGIAFRRTRYPTWLMEEPSRLNMACWCVPEVADLPEALFLVTDPESGWEFMSEFPDPAPV